MYEQNKKFNEETDTIKKKNQMRAVKKKADLKN